MTFLQDEIWDAARQSFAQLMTLDPQSVLLTQNTTQALQMIMQSFLVKSGDEFVTTSHEHGSLKTIARYLEETRGIVVRIHGVEPHDGSAALTEGILKLVSDTTRLVAVSEIASYSGWRPDLTDLNQKLAASNIPFLVDGAHAPGQGPSAAATYPPHTRCRWRIRRQGGRYLERRARESPTPQRLALGHASYLGACRLLLRQ